MIKTTIAAALISLTTLAAVPAQASGFGVQVDIGPGWSDNGHGRDGWRTDHSGRGWRDHGRRHEMRGYRLSTDEMRMILRQSGYYQIRFIDQSGPVNQVFARRNGDSYFLIVSSRNGEILSRQRV